MSSIQKSIPTINTQSMNKMMNILLFLIVTFSLINCTPVKKEKQHYENQIGDTPFNADLDNSNFKFCDSTNVLHKRAFVKYEGGGIRAIQEAFAKKYIFDASYQSYSGYFIIRFVVNCKNEAGRFRMQTLDSAFKPSKPPEKLRKHILTIVKDLKGWKHPIYNGKDYDGYKFITIKIVNGKIE